MEVLKQIANVAGLRKIFDESGFTPAQLPFFFSDIQIFMLAAFVYSKPNTNFNKAAYVAFMTQGLFGALFLLVCPLRVISFKTLTENDFEYSTAHSLICHYVVFYVFI
jgi:hypothetical protein